MNKVNYLRNADKQRPFREHANNCEVARRVAHRQFSAEDMAAAVEVLRGIRNECILRIRHKLK